MSLFRTGAIVAIMFLVNGSATLLAETEGSSKDIGNGAILTLSNELRNIRVLLEQNLRVSLDAIQASKLNAAVLYLQFRTRRIEVLEEQLRDFKKMKMQAESEVASFEKNRESLNAQLRALAEEGQDAAVGMMAGLEIELDRSKEKVKQLEITILDIENEIAETRRELFGLQEFVDNAFDL